MERFALLLVLLVVGLSLAREARAAGGDADPMRLDVEGAEEARCASAETLRARIAERLGRDPFTDTREGRARLRVVFARKRGGYTGAVVLEGAGGERLGARSLERDGATCDPLVTDVVLVVAVLLEDLAPRPEPQAAEPPPTPPASTPAASEPAPPPPPPAPALPADSVHVDFALGGGSAFGLAPRPAVAGEIVSGLDVSRLRVEVSGRMTLPASGDGDVAVRTQIVTGRLAPCYGFRVLSPCASLAIGSISGEAIGRGVVAARSAGQLYAGAGAGLVSRVFFAEDRIFVRAAVEVLFALARAGFDVGGQRVWGVPPVSASATVGLGVRLP